MGWIDRVTIFSNFKMQHGALRAAAAELCNHLPGFYSLPFANQNLPVVRVRAQVMLVMIYNDQIAITQ